MAGITVMITATITVTITVIFTVIRPSGSLGLLAADGWLVGR